jgi:hypothetical protein
VTFVEALAKKVRSRGDRPRFEGKLVSVGELPGGGGVPWFDARNVEAHVAWRRSQDQEDAGTHHDAELGREIAAALAALGIP